MYKIRFRISNILRFIPSQLVIEEVKLKLVECFVLRAELRNLDLLRETNLIQLLIVL
jgi:hypothetical protein